MNYIKNSFVCVTICKHCDGAKYWNDSATLAKLVCVLVELGYTQKWLSCCLHYLNGSRLKGSLQYSCLKTWLKPAIKTALFHNLHLKAEERESYLIITLHKQVMMLRSIAVWRLIDLFLNPGTVTSVKIMEFWVVIPCRHVGA